MFPIASPRQPLLLLSQHRIVRAGHRDRFLHIPQRFPAQRADILRQSIVGGDLRNLEMFTTVLPHATVVESARSTRAKPTLTRAYLQPQNLVKQLVQEVVVAVGFQNWTQVRPGLATDATYFGEIHWDLRGFSPKMRRLGELLAKS